MPGLNAHVGRALARDPYDNLLPVLPVTDVEIAALPEYSTSLPTGKTIGKRWRRRIKVGDGTWVYWTVGEYAELSPEDQEKYPGEIAILWYLPSVDGGTPGKWGGA